MSNSRVINAVTVLLLAACVAGAQTTVTNTFGNINRVIPDGQPTGMSDTRTLAFDIPQFSSITNVEVTLNLSGGYSGDIYAYLTHGDGFAVLLNRVGRSSANLVGYSDSGMDVTLSANGNDIHQYQTFSPTIEGGQLKGIWGVDGRNIDPKTVVTTTPQTALLSSFNGTDPNGSWTLFLADMDAGDQSTLVQWSVILTAVPEPSTFVLAGLGGLVMGMRLLRRRTA